MRKYISFIFILFVVSSCKEEPDPTPLPPTSTELYFPDNWVAAWETTDPEDLNWNTDEIEALYQFLDESDTRGFIVLSRGKIVLEHYNGNGLGGQPFGRSSQWYWASAGKTLAASAVGIAEQEGYLNLNDPVSNILGAGWTSATANQESQIQVQHLLTMTSGLDDGVPNSDCFDPGCLEYLTDPETRWAYHNGAYTKLHDLVTVATSHTFEQFVQTRITNVIGLAGSWFWIGDNHVFFSNTRGMARFGLLNLNQGVWKDSTVINANYFADMVHPSQTINPSYGYLYWINGESSYKLPGLQTSFNGPICPNAPEDMYAGIGKNSQCLFVVPSEDLVVVRLGDNPDQSLVPLNFMNDLWEKLNAVMNR